MSTHIIRFSCFINNVIAKLITISISTTTATTRPKNSETHFKVVVVSSKFDSVKLPLERHRMINAILSQELTSKGGPVHALSIVAKSPSQWSKMMEENPTGDVVIESSPRCRGGDGSLPSSSSKR